MTAMVEHLRFPGVDRPRARMVTLQADHIERLEFRSAAEERLVRQGLANLLIDPRWSWACLLDERVAGVGGFVWVRPTWCYGAIAAARWLRPIDWRPFLKPIRERIKLVHKAGARRIDTNVDARNMKAHRLVMALGFVFVGLALAHDDTMTPWVTYARFDGNVPPMPPEVLAAMFEAHGHILGAWAEEEI